MDLEFLYYFMFILIFKLLAEKKRSERWNLCEFSWTIPKIIVFIHFYCLWLFGFHLLTQHNFVFICAFRFDNWFAWCPQWWQVNFCPSWKDFTCKWTPPGCENTLPHWSQGYFTPACFELVWALRADRDEDLCSHRWQGYFRPSCLVRMWSFTWSFLDAW